MANDRWLEVTIRNKKTGETITLYHTPANAKDVDQRLRYGILERPQPPTDALLSITALPSGADWITQKIPAAEALATCEHGRAREACFGRLRPCRATTVASFTSMQAGSVTETRARSG